MRLHALHAELLVGSVHTEYQASNGSAIAWAAWRNMAELFLLQSRDTLAKITAGRHLALAPAHERLRNRLGRRVKLGASRLASIYRVHRAVRRLRPATKLRAYAGKYGRVPRRLVVLAAAVAAAAAPWAGNGCWSVVAAATPAGLKRRGPRSPTRWRQRGRLRFPWCSSSFSSGGLVGA